MIVKRTALRLFGITLGSLVYAAGLGLFLEPLHLAPGGVTGLAIIVNYFTQIPTGTLVLCMNVPLLILGIWKFGFRFFLSTIYATTLSSFLINLFSQWGPLTQEFMLAALAGGGLMALGMGTVFRCGATTGGLDIFIRFVKLRFPHIKTGKLFLITDTVVIMTAALAFQNLDLALFAAVSTVTASYVFDVVLYGADSARLVYIITDRDETLAAKLLAKDIGVTFLKGEGAFTGSRKRVILCAVRKQLLPMVQELALTEDPQAFLIVSSANEIFGEGFKSAKDERI